MIWAFRRPRFFYQRVYVKKFFFVEFRKKYKNPQIPLFKRISNNKYLFDLPKLAISQSCFKSNVDLTKGQ
jgi:hypothetical protein